MAISHLWRKSQINCKKINLIVSYMPNCFREQFNHKIRLQQIQFLHLKVYDENKEKHLRKAHNNAANIFQELEQMNITSRQEYMYLNEKVNDMQNDSDTFGISLHRDILENEGDCIEEEYKQSKTYNSKLRNIDYARLIKCHLNNDHLKKALDVLETQMLKVDRIKPDNYIYSLLISGCAQKGFTRKAFKLFNKMRQRGLKVKPGTFTSLFNSCANAPSVQDGLNRANYLRDKMIEYGYEPNEKNYNAMIKAYGRCNDVKTAFLLADEMKDKSKKLNIETFNLLLQACASDKKFGFRQLLDTWHKLLKIGLRPDYHTFSAVLKCTRDCGFGDTQSMKQFLIDLFKEEKQSFDNITDDVIRTEVSNVKKKSNPFEIVDCSVASTQVLTSSSTELQVPNLLMACPQLGNLVSLDEMKKPHQRFLLIGGLNGYLKLMKLYNVTPDIQLFTAILELIPPTKAAEKQLISWVQKIGLKADIDFFNILMKKRSLRFDYNGAKEILSMAQIVGLKPDIVTYGILALGCRTAEEARELIQTMKEKDIQINIQILGAMLRQGTAQNQFQYVSEIMQISLDENIKPNGIFLKHLKNFYDKNASAIDARDYGKFCKKLRIYYEENGIAGLKLSDAIKKIEERPNEQYREMCIEGLEDVKHEKIFKKSKLRKHIKKIKLANFSNDTNIIKPYLND